MFNFVSCIMQYDLSVSIHVSKLPVTESEGTNSLLSKSVSHHCVALVRGLIGGSSYAAMISR
jgi:hypothetical protein